MTAYAASSYLWLTDYQEAETHARAALAVHAAAPPASRSPSREAIARIDLGLALAHLHQPEQAASLGRQALSSPSVVDSVLSRAGELNAALVTCHPQLPCTQEFRERYRTMTQSAHTREEHRG